MVKKIISIFIILILVGVASFYGYRYYFSKNKVETRQAVFMTNGQVYFGYLSNPANQVVTLKNIYYLKAQDLSQDSSATGKKIVLVKLGNELHSPEDLMYINRDQILFYQDLRADSKINDAIEKFSVKTPSEPSTSPSN